MTETLASNIGTIATNNGNLNTIYLMQQGFFASPCNHIPIKELGDYGRLNFKNDYFILEFGAQNIAKQNEPPKYIWAFKSVYYCH